MATFLTIPVEIRSQIYTHLVASRLNKIRLADGYSCYRFHLNIFRACRQTYDEAKEVFRRQNIFLKIETPWHQAEEQVAVEGQVPLLIVGKRADDFRDVHLSASVDVPEMAYSREAMNKFILCCDDGIAFCRMWFYSDLTHPGLNSHLRLNLTLRNPSPRAWSDRDIDLPKTLQRELLAPFVQIKGLKSINVEGTIDSNVMQDFLRDNAETYDSPERCLERCTQLKDAGNTAINKGRYQDAVDLYFQAFDAMHIVVSGHKRTVWADPFFDRVMEGGPYDKQHGSIVRMILRIRLVANVIQAYLKLENYIEAKFWGKRSIELMRQYLGGAADHPRYDFPGAEAWGKIYFRAGLACKAMDEQDEARELIRIAADWLPNDQIVQKVKAETSLRLM